ncbi:MAG: sulfite exporter TauE/SafE family protein [Myxococcales bacterium]|nr:MAG: sulfite exporter TauE/SafE family protein [Myxococcales bacterium]
MHFDIQQLTLAWIVTAFAGVVQGTIGFGYAVLSVPVLALINPLFAPMPQILMSLPMTSFMAYRERSNLEWQGIGWILIGRLPGTIAGAWLLVVASQVVLQRSLALVVFLAALIIGSGVSLPRTKLTRTVAGFISGIASMTSAIGGPPLALLYRDLPGPVMRSSLGAVFFVGVLLSAIALTFTGRITMDVLVIAALLSPALLLGTYLSRFLTGRVEGKPLRTATLAVSVMAAVLVLIRSL